MEDGDVIDAHLQQARLIFLFTISAHALYDSLAAAFAPTHDLFPLLLNIYSAPHCRVRSLLL